MTIVGWSAGATLTWLDYIRHNNRLTQEDGPTSRNRLARELHARSRQSYCPPNESSVRPEHCRPAMSRHRDLG